MQLITLSPRGFGANTYVLVQENNQAILIDPSQERVESELIKRGITPKYVLLTHCHFDHVGGVEVLQKSGAKVLCSVKEKPLIGTMADLFDAFGAPRCYYTVDKTLEDNEEIENDEFSVFALLITFRETMESFSRNSDFKKKEPKNLNRHWIMHGRSRRRKTKLDCIKTIRFIYGIILIDELSKKDEFDNIV
jgi:metal-dependent hydrolase (beta-lactamase superfamily II)